MLAYDGLIFPPWKYNLGHPDTSRCPHQPIEVVVPARIQNFTNEVTPITRISSSYYFKIFIQGIKRQLVVQPK